MIINKETNKQNNEFSVTWENNTQKNHPVG
jgi:hypothetical protein